VATRAPAGDFVRLFAVLAGAVVVGILVQAPAGRVPLPAVRGPVFRRAVLVGGSSLVLLAAAAPQAEPRLGSRVAGVLGTLKGDRLNARDQDRMVKGYYEDLLGTEGWGSMLWSIRLEEPEDWRYGGVPVREVIRETGRMRGGEYYPDLDLIHKGTTFRTNRWGMRDEEVEPEKPEGTFRIVLLGSSYAEGAGVEAEATFGERLERSLRERPLSEACTDTQILNFSFPGDSIIRQVTALAQSALQFQPDAVLVVATTNERLHAVRNVRDAVLNDVPDLHPDLRALLDRAGIAPTMAPEEVERRLNAHADELLTWGYRSLARIAAERGMDVLWFLLPLTDDDDRRFEESYADLSELVRAQGLTPVSLGGVYGDLNERDQVRLAAWDWHPNREGHARIAERIEAELRKRAFLGRLPRMRRPG